MLLSHMLKIQETATQKCKIVCEINPLNAQRVSNYRWRKWYDSIIQIKLRYRYSDSVNLPQLSSNIMKFMNNVYSK